MKNNFFNSYLANIHSKPSSKSEVLSQILYGEKFRILNKKKGWVKIRTNYDNYIGFIKKDNFYKNFKPELKIFKFKSKIFIKKNSRFLPSKKYLYFASGVSILNSQKNFIEFKKNKWIKKKDTREISHKEKNFIKILKLFLKSKYLWGGKTSDGIDCSALIQIYFYYNRIFFPRDSKKQIKFCKRNSRKRLIKGDIIFWKGHVGMCLNNSQFIHAYGPKKKVIIMPTKFTIDLINKTANLVVKKVSNIKNY
mgnify:CR=1 FL=1|tara:strand:- start:524 stop:1276 length:753 start_codon:yes stop_codon:yes gene_type:complete